MRAALRLLRRSAGRGGGAPSATSHGRRRGLLAYSGPGDEMGPFPHGAAHSLRHADPPPGVPGRAGPRSRYVTSRYVTSRVWAPARAGCGRGGRSGNVVPHASRGATCPSGRGAPKKLAWAATCNRNPARPFVLRGGGEGGATRFEGAGGRRLLCLDERGPRDWHEAWGGGAGGNRQQY
ncbi:hypothetical protein JHW43_004904 [Diplocarpon mali]|nr:hypothetical protein JHW43_004904 [Diplocarpon mali]